MGGAHGLVAKASTWHLVWRRDVDVRVLRVSRVVDARRGDESFVRSPDFDLAAFWAEWCAELEENGSSYPVTVRAALQFLPWLPCYFGEQMRDVIAQVGPPDAGGWATVELPFGSLEEARDRVLGFGGAVAVLAPGPCVLV